MNNDTHYYHKFLSIAVDHTDITIFIIVHFFFFSVRLFIIYYNTRLCAHNNISTKKARINTMIFVALLLNPFV